MRNPRPGFFPRGGGSWAAPLSLASRQKEPVGAGEGVGVEFGDGDAASEVLGRPLPASGVGRPARAAGAEATSASVGSAGTAVSTASLGLARGRPGVPLSPACPRRLRGPREPSPLFQRLPFQPRSTLDPRCSPPRDGEGPR